MAEEKKPTEETKTKQGQEEKTFTISQVAELMNVAPSTLRYYDKEGLLPNIKRVNGIRIFEVKDFRWLKVLTCLKNTGMPIRRIKEYAKLAQEGDKTINERYQLIKDQRQLVLDQIDQLNYYMKELDYKEWYYETALKLGSEGPLLEKRHPSINDIKEVPEKLDVKELMKERNQDNG